MRLIVAIIIILFGIIAVIASEHASENGGMPVTQASFDTSGFEWQPNQVCFIHKSPKRINRA